MKKIIYIFIALTFLVSCGLFSRNTKLSLETQYKFEDFPVEVYSGKLSASDFNNNPYASRMGYVEYMTDKCESEGINFGGRFVMIHKRERIKIGR